MLLILEDFFKKRGGALLIGVATLFVIFLYNAYRATAGYNYSSEDWSIFSLYGLMQAILAFFQILSVIGVLVFILILKERKEHKYIDDYIIYYILILMLLVSTLLYEIV